jgi:hypothetical protein
VERGVIFLLALIPATALTAAGYVVLYLSTRSEGTQRTFGRYLAYWAFTLAGLVILGGLLAAAHHHRHAGMYGMHCPWEERRDIPSATQPQEPATPPAR